MVTTDKDKIWSSYPREACTIITDSGSVVGVGAHPIFDSVPGAWNIFWLTFAPLDQLAYYQGDPDKYLITCDALAVCAGAALQPFPSGNHAPLGELAETVSPLAFIERVRKIPTFLPSVFYGEKWFTVATSRAKRHRKIPDNVVHVDFRRAK